jgi:septum site-determining protein MinC
MGEIVRMVDKHEPGDRSRINVRGTRDGLVIHFPEDPSPLDLIQDLQDQIENAGNFFRRGELVINYGTRPPDQDEIGALLVLLRGRGVRLRTVTAGTARYRNLLQQWGFDQPRPRHGITEDPHEDQFPEAERGAYHIHEPLQPGDYIELDGTLVVHGDVSPGATIVASRSVIVWGTLRGMVHAGSNGDHSAVVCALRLMPEELRIGSFRTRASDDPDALPDIPAMAKVVSNELVAAVWRSGR